MIRIIRIITHHLEDTEIIEEIPHVLDHQALEDLQTDLKGQGLHNPAKNKQPSTLTNI